MARTLTITGAYADFRSGGDIQAGTGILAFTSASGVTFIPKSGTKFPRITQNGSGTTTITTNALVCSTLTISVGTFHMGSGFVHSIDNFVSTKKNPDPVIDFGSSVMQIMATGTEGIANFRYVATVPGTGALKFVGAGAQTFTPSQATVGSFPTIVQAGTGPTTVSTYGFRADSLIIASGTFDLGAALLDTFSNVVGTASGELQFNTATLTAVGGMIDLNSIGTVTPNTGTLQFSGTSLQTFIPKAGITSLRVIQNGASGSTTISTNALSCSTLTITSGTFGLGSGFTHTVPTITGSATGTLDFGSSKLRVSQGNAIFTNLPVIPGTGALEFTGTSQAFYPRAGAVFPTIIQNGTGPTTITTTNLRADSLVLTSGIFNLGVARLDTFTSVVGTGSGTLQFNTGTLIATGGMIDLNSMGSVTPNTGYLQFSGSGAQTFVPKAGISALRITQNGSGGMTTITTSALTCSTLTITDGTFGLGMGLVHSVPTITGSATGTLDFGSSKLTIRSGNATFTSLPVVASTGALEFTGTNQIFYPRAGAVFPTIIQNGTGPTTVTTANLRADSLVLTSGIFNLGVARLDTFTSVVGTGSGTLQFNTGTLIATGGMIDLNSIGTVTPNTGYLQFSGSASQSFIPKTGISALRITRNGASGITTVMTNALICSTLTVTDGTLGLGSGLAHSVPTITGSAAGTLDFGSSKLTIRSGNATFTNLPVTAGTGALEFTGTNQIFYPRAADIFPKIIQNGTGPTTVTTANLRADSLVLTSGIFNLGVARLDTFTSVVGTGSGTLQFNTGTLIATGAMIDLGSIGTVTPNTGILQFSGTSTQTFIPKVGITSLRVTRNGTSGSTTVSATALSCSTLTVTTGTFNLGSGLTHTVAAVTGSATGNLNFGSSKLRVGVGNATFTNLPVAAGTGALEFGGTSQIFSPRAGGVFPKIIQNGTGPTTVTTANLRADSLILTSGIFNLGVARLDTFTSVVGTGASVLDFNTATLVCLGGRADLNSVGTLTQGTGALVMAGAAAQVLVPKTGDSLYSVAIRNSGGATTTISTNPLVATAGLFINNSANLNLGNGFTHRVSKIVGTGTVNLGSCSLFVFADSADFRNITIPPSPSVLVFSNQTGDAQFLPNALSSLPTVDIRIGAAQTATVRSNGFAASKLVLTSGTLDLGTNYTATATDFEAAGGNLNFGTACTLEVEAPTVNFSALGTITVSAGSMLKLIADAGVQTFTPKSASLVHPLVYHTGAGTLRLSTYSLRTNGFYQSSGILDLLGADSLITVAGGPFTIVNGGAGSVANLGGKVIVVAGNASLSGLPADRLGLSPGAGWEIRAAGSLTAQNAVIGNSLASLSTGYAVSSDNGGSNTNWSFGSVRVWDGEGNDNRWNTAANWSGNIIPDEEDTVSFGSQSVASCTLDVSPTVKSIVFTSSYTGNFHFSNQTLTVVGGADFSTGGTVSKGTGALEFAGASAQVFTSKSGLYFPKIVQSGPNGTGVAVGGFKTDTLEITMGTFTLGAATALADTVGVILGLGGSVNFGMSSLCVLGETADFSGLLSVTAGTGALVFSGGTPHDFFPKSGGTFPAIKQSGSGTTTIQGTNLVAGALTVAQGTLDLGVGLTHTFASVVNAAPSTGIIDFGSSVLCVGSGNADFRNIGVTPGTGKLAFTGAGAQTFYPHSGTMLLDIEHSIGAGTTTISTNRLHCLRLLVTTGTFNLGAALQDTITSISGAGSLNFSSSTLTSLGDTVDFSAMAAITPSTGTLRFSKSSGVQVFVPKAGSAHPPVVHGEAGALRLMTNDLSASSFTQTAGSLDFNGRDISTVSGGNFTIVNGTSTTLANLGGRTITVDGNASFAGQVGNRIGLNPDSGWTIAVSGTLQADYATIANSNASLAGGAAFHSLNDGGNTNWVFGSRKEWDGEAGDSKWSTPLNWSDDVLPVSGDTVAFGAAHVGNCLLDTSATVKALLFTSGYTGNFDFTSQKLTVSGNADFRTGGTLTKGTGILEFSGSSAQVFYPKVGFTFSKIVQNGSVYTVASAGGFRCDTLEVLAGTFNLGAALADTAGVVIGANGTLKFSSSTLCVTGKTANFSAFDSIAGGTGTLIFSGTTPHSFLPKSGATFPAIRQAGTGTTTLQGAGLTAGALTMAQGTLNLGTNLVHTVASIAHASPNTGAVNFSSSTMQITTGSANFRYINVVPGTGRLVFTRAGAQTLYPRAGVIMPDIEQNAEAGTTTIIGNNLRCRNMILTAGALNLGVGLQDTIESVRGAGSLVFGSSTFVVLGDTANFGSLTSLTASTGTLCFVKGSGVQVLIPKAGTLHPPVIHSAAGTLRLSTNDLASMGFTQSSGRLDLNGSNMSTDTSGNFVISNGTTTSLVNLGGRTIAVAKDAVLMGQAGSKLNLDPDSVWTIAVTGLLQADHAMIANSNASVSQGFATNSIDSGGNANWSFVFPGDSLMVKSLNLMPAYSIGEREQEMPALRLVFRNPNAGLNTINVTRVEFTMTPEDPSDVVMVKRLRRKGQSTDHFSSATIETSNPMALDLSSSPIRVHGQTSDTFDVLFDVVGAPSSQVAFTVDAGTSVEASDSATGDSIAVVGDGVAFPMSSSTGSLVAGSATPSGKHLDSLLTEWSFALERVDAHGADHFYTTWDHSNLYFVWNGRNLASSGDLFIYLGTQTGGKGTTWNYGGMGSHTLPGAFDGADFVYYYDGAGSQGLRNGDSTYSARTFTGSASADDQTVVVRLPLADIGLPDTVRIIAFVQNENSAQILASIPHDQVGEFTRNPVGAAPKTFLSWVTITPKIYGQTPTAVARFDSVSMVHPTWIYSLGSGNYAAGISVGTGVLYISVGGSNPALVVLDKATGAHKWTHTLANEPTPVAVYYEQAGAKFVLMFCEGNNFRAGYDDVNGFGEFGASPVGLGSQGGPPARSIPPDGGGYADVYAYFATANGSLRKIHAKNGVITWSALSSYNANPKSVASSLSDRVFIGCTDGYVRSFRTSDGGLINEYNTGDSVNSRITYASGIATIYCSPKGQTFYALNSNLSLKWNRSMGVVMQASPFYAYGSTPPVVYCPAGNGIVAVIDSTTKGGTKWTASTAGAITTDPVALGSAVYFASNDKRHFAVNATTGALMAGWPTAVLENENRSRIVSDATTNSIYIGGGDGKIYRYPKQ